jgi:photosystem II stability/assembly factor-like uncharacterized protein
MMHTLESRIREAARATAEEIAPGSIPPLSLTRPAPSLQPDPGGPLRGRPGWPRVLIPLAAAASVVAVVAAVLVTTGGPQGGLSEGTSPASAPAASPGSPGIASSSFRYIGTVPRTDSLDCVTASVCYAWDSGDQDAAQRTSDGGATWRPVAALPDHKNLSAETVSPSCPTAEVCAAAAGGLTLAVTTDGGTRWNLESLPRPPGISGARIDQVSCATAAECVVHVASRGPGTFLSTSNGGKTWTAASEIPQNAPTSLLFLRCDPGGHCIGVFPAGTNTNGGLLAMRSADNGRTWAVSSVHAPPSDIFMMSCSDGLHCMSVSDSGAMMTTSDGGVTWQARGAPRGWPDVASSVSCPAAGVCFIALAESTGTSLPGYRQPAVEATRDDGRTWTALSLPTANGSPLAIVFPMSCPSAEGCIGVAATPRQFSGAGRSQVGKRTIISSFPGR